MQFNNPEILLIRKDPLEIEIANDNDDFETGYTFSLLVNGLVVSSMETYTKEDITKAFRMTENEFSELLKVIPA